MIHCGRREPCERFWPATCRAGTVLFAITVLAGAWHWARPSVLYALARANLGNRAAGPLIDQAVRERHPDLPWGPRESFNASLFHLQSFAGRRAGAVLPVRPPITELSLGGPMLVSFSYTLTYRHPTERPLLLVDERLDRVGLLHGVFGSGLPPDDRDGDGEFELVLQTIGRDVYTVLRTANRVHRLLAVIDLAPGTLAAPRPFSRPMWTDRDGDDLHELEWLSFATPVGGGATPALSSEFTLHWAAPGRLTCEPPPPAGARLWLPKAGEVVEIPDTESIADAAERLLSDMAP